MSNIIDYVENEMNRFEIKKFNAVDSLVLSQFSYVHFEQAVPDFDDNNPPVRIKDLLHAEMFGSMFHNVRDSAGNRRLLFAMAASPRFRDIRMNYHANKIDFRLEEQFSAVTYQLEDGTVYVAYRGTDSTLIGWKEDFNMAFITPVPSQEEGVRYLDAIAARMPGALRIGGHSKGGNIAVYSAIHCNPATQDRVLTVYSHDGPGFKEGVLESSGFRTVQDRVQKTLPQSSLIGMLLENQENYSVVESNRIGIMQHDPFSWYVEQSDFRYTDTISGGARYMHRTLNQWLSAMSDEKRSMFVDTLFQILGASEASTVSEFSEDWRKRSIAMLGAFKNIDPETRKMVRQTINALVKMTFKNLKAVSAR